MRFSRRVVQILLIIAVVTSIVLSFFVWSNTARYQLGKDIDLTESSSYDKDNIPIDQIISPTQVIWHDGKNQKLIYNSKENISYTIQESMKKWKIQAPELVFKKDGAKYQQKIQQKDTIQLVYPTQISVNTLGYILGDKILQKASDKTFDRIIFTTNNGKDPFVYLADDDSYTVYRAKVGNASSLPVLDLAKKSNINYDVQLNTMKQGIRTFFREPISMQSYSYVITSKNDSEYTSPLFSSSKYDISTSQNGDNYIYAYGDSLRLESDHSTGELTFNDYSDNSVPKNRLDFFLRGYNKVTKIESSVSNLRLFRGNYKQKSLIYREYVEGFPIFNKTTFGSVKINFSRDGSTEMFINRVLEVPVPSDQQKTELKPTSDILTGLVNSGYLANDIEDIEVGYQWKNEENADNVVDLVPTYYVKMQGKWKTYSEWTNLSALEE
ncbi:YycH family regulatory protein [Companilactobacillus metriopterae]|uniref:YycH family regulatory protein n=1 Tax=Companilactobacillus metriopterae TaxID=1909267 RepID=UPI00100A6387|nr:two-component system activity regulator YycH [Companilactobacillus metriopterae]